MASSGLSILWFLAIVALIPLTLWFLKRSGLANGAVGSLGAAVQAPVRPVAQYNIGPGQRVVTVEVGSGDDKKWLVLGVTAQQINMLHTMAPQSAQDAASGQPVAPLPPFAALLRRAFVQNDKGQS